MSASKKSSRPSPAAKKPATPPGGEKAAATDPSAGAEQTPRAGGGSSSALVTALGAIIAALVLALVLVSVNGARNSSTAKETVTVTVNGSGAAPAGDQGQQKPQGVTPQTNVDEKTKKARLEVARNQPGDPMAFGKEDAPVVMVDFSDLRCPFCARFSNEIMPQLQKYIDDGTLRVEYRDAVLFGEDSKNAAIAARAAGKQGKYHDFVVALYKAAPPEGGHPPMPRSKLVGFAKQAGVPDIPAFEKDLADPALATAVDKDTQYATSIGVTGTPLFLVNTQVLSGAQPVEVFTTFIEHEKKNNPRK